MQVLDWAAPIVVVLKSDKLSICICGDLKQTVNLVSKLDKHPIPKIEDLSAMAVERGFSKVNLSQAYQQLPFSDDQRPEGAVLIRGASVWYLFGTRYL